MSREVQNELRISKGRRDESDEAFVNFQLWITLLLQFCVGMFSCETWTCLVRNHSMVSCRFVSVRIMMLNDVSREAAAS